VDWLRKRLLNLKFLRNRLLEIKLRKMLERWLLGIHGEGLQRGRFRRLRRALRNGLNQHLNVLSKLMLLLL